MQPLEEDDDLIAATKKYVVAYPFKELMNQPVVFSGDVFFMQDGKFNQNWVYITDSVLRIYKERRFEMDAEDQEEPIL